MDDEAPQYPVHPYKKPRKYIRPKSRKKAEVAGMVLGPQSAATAEQRAEAGRILHERRYSLMSRNERREQASKAAQAYWEGMSPEERSLEMRRRARLARKRRMAARLAKIRKPQG